MSSMQQRRHDHASYIMKTRAYQLLLLFYFLTFWSLTRHPPGIAVNSLRIETLPRLPITRPTKLGPHINSSYVSNFEMHIKNIM